MLLLRLSGLLLLRHAERQFLGLLFQEPPRLAACPLLRVLPIASSVYAYPPILRRLLASEKP